MSDQPVATETDLTTERPLDEAVGIRVPPTVVDLRPGADPAGTWFRQAFEHAPMGVAVVSGSGAIVLANQSFADCFGDLDHVLGTRLGDHRFSDGSAVANGLPVVTRAATEQYRRADGSVFWGRVSITPIADGSVDNIIHIEDVTADVEATSQLAELALRDGLTGLPNRAVLLEVFAGAAARSRRSAARIAVLFVDLDHFKAVNDTCGHAAGDLTLVEVAARLKQLVREGDLVVRFGGDEFVIVLENLPTDMTAARHEAQAVGQRLVEGLAEPIAHDDHDHQIGASAGIVVADGAADVDALIRHADAALYRAKDAGRGCVEMFDDLELAETLRTAAALRDDATDAETSTVRTRLRPVLGADGNEVGVEVLVDAGDAPGGVDERLRRLGRFSVDIPVILRTAAAAALEQPVVHLAIPPAVFRELAVDVIVLDECERFGADPARLALSVASPSLAEGTADLIELRALAAHGVKIGVGDFGIQSANIIDLRRPFVSFVRMRTTDADDPTSGEHLDHLRAIADLVATLGRTITAWRVDDVETAAAWLDLGATQLCGTVTRADLAAHIGD